MHESVSDDEGTMSRRDDQERWQWREEVRAAFSEATIKASWRNTGLSKEPACTGIDPSIYARG